MIQIAFCDDDQTVLDQLSALLEKYRAQRCVQIQCTAFHSPLDLLAEIEKGTRYDILFLDVIMPAENGITAAKEIRQYDNVVKIIFLTSSAEFASLKYYRPFLIPDLYKLLIPIRFLAQNRLIARTEQRYYPIHLWECHSLYPKHKT